MKPVVLLDLDNCIADDHWRHVHIDLRKTGDARFETYHSLAAFDRAETAWMDDFPEIAEARAIVLTARPSKWRAMTQEWWNRVVVPQSGLQLSPSMIMRPDGNTMHSVELKKMMLGWVLDPNTRYLYPGEEIVGAFDDRADVVAMYREHGIAGHAHAITAGQTHYGSGVGCAVEVAGV